MWVRLDEGLLSLSTCRSDWMGAPITVPVGSMDGYSYHSTCGLDWMGAPITVLVGQFGWGLPSPSACGSDWIRGSYRSTNHIAVHPLILSIHHPRVNGKNYICFTVVGY